MPPLEHIVQSGFPEGETVASCTSSSQNVPLIRGLPGTRITLIVISRASGPVTKSTTCCRHPVVPSNSSLLPIELLVIVRDANRAQAQMRPPAPPRRPIQGNSQSPKSAANPSPRDPGAQNP